MGEVVNLRIARKRKARTEKAAEADANRLKHGRSKAERQQARDEAERAALHLDGHRRDPG